MQKIKLITGLVALATLILSCRNQNSPTLTEQEIKITSSEPINYLSTPSRLKPIVDSIISINILEHEAIGIGGWEGSNYRNFKQLKKMSTDKELVILTQNENPVVSCYASWALADQSYQDLDSIFKIFIEQNRTVETFSGCIMSHDSFASVLYHRYWNNISLEHRAQDPILKALDSTILFGEPMDWLLLSRALENRIYNEPLKDRIVLLAIEKTDREALLYLSKWYKAEFKSEIKTGLLKYLTQNDFKNTGYSDYYTVVKSLLELNDNEVNEIIIDKMKKDKHWNHIAVKFIDLLNDNDIYYFN